MSYSTTAQVNRLLGPHAVTTSTLVTTSDVEALRNEASYNIDAKLRSYGVSVIPVTNTVVANYLGVLESWCVASRVLKILFPEAVGAGEQPAHAYWKSLCDEGLKTLPTLIRGWEGTGLVSIVSMDSIQASGYFTEHTEEEAELGDLEGAHLFGVDPLDQHPW